MPKDPGLDVVTEVPGYLLMQGFRAVEPAL
jgi:hypothetical protein